MWFKVFKVALFVLVALPGCASRDDCSGFQNPPIQITVLDSQTGERICDASVTATLEGQSPVELAMLGSAAGCVYEDSGSVSLSGSIIITASAPGHMSQTLSTTVSEDACGRSTDYAAIRLST